MRQEPSAKASGSQAPQETGLQRGTILGCVLAGGLSRRMGGGDKALIEIGGRPMLAHVIDRLAPQVAALILNANGEPQRFESFGIPVVSDPIEGFIGPLAGMLAAMREGAARQGIGYVVTVAGDTPFFPVDLVARLAAAAQTPDTIVLAASGGNRHPVFGLWPVALADDLEDWLSTTDTYKVVAWVERHRLAMVDFDLVRRGGQVIDPFFNANRPEDIVIAERHIAELVP